MSTQHPDNASPPFFSDSSVMEFDDEIKEAYFVFSLGCREQMWDIEGKEADAFVVRKLLGKYPEFFREKKIGKDVFITPRVPNPGVEKTEAKVLLEALESIPRNMDLACTFYGSGCSAPIFEVIIPMTQSAKELLMVKEYYEKIVIGKSSTVLAGSKTISEWIGSFEPEKINVIPLLETKEAMLNSAKIVKEYLEKSGGAEYQRVFLARSDPALNYGSSSAVLINEIALQRLALLEEELGKKILPIIGVGSAPFRGNFSPANYRGGLEGYPSVQTFTLQSAFKYGFKASDVKKAIDEIEDSKRKRHYPLDEEKALQLIEKTTKRYIEELTLIVDHLEVFFKSVPSRRKRKLHIGLFGYSRGETGIKLPRAIGFCAAFYSIGVPPDLLGLSALSEKDFGLMKGLYPEFESDMADALKWACRENISKLPGPIPKNFFKVLENFSFAASEEHERVAIEAMYLAGKNHLHAIEEKIVEAANIRGFLG